MTENEKRFRIEFTVDAEDWSDEFIKESAIQELTCMVPFPKDITFSEANPWHTGTPSEDGWYLVAYECVYECANKGKIEYHTMHIFTDVLGYKDTRGRASDDVWKAVAWQKIEENKDVHID